MRLESPNGEILTEIQMQLIAACEKAKTWLETLSVPIYGLYHTELLVVGAENINNGPGPQVIQLGLRAGFPNVYLGQWVENWLTQQGWEPYSLSETPQVAFGKSVLTRSHSFKRRYALS